MNGAKAFWAACAGVVLGLVVARPAPAIEPPRQKEVWRVVTVADVTVISNAREAVLGEVAGEIIAMRAAMGRATHLKVSSPLPTKVYIFKSTSSFAPYRDAIVGRGATTTAGLFMSHPDGNYLLVDESEGEAGTATLYHELTHYLVNNTAPGIPLWLNEGLAELYSTFKQSGDHVDLGRPIPDHVHLLRSEALMPLGKLFSVTRSSPEYSEWRRQGMFYAQSWATVHYLLIGSNTPTEQISRLLALLTKGVPADVAFEQAMGITAATFEEKLQAYLRRPAFPFVTVAVGDLDLPPVPAARQLPYDEVLFQLGDLLAHANPATVADGEAFLTEAIRLNPALAPAYAVRASLEMQLHAIKDAIADFEKAIALGATDAQPYLLYGEQLLTQLVDAAQRGESVAPERVARARELFKKAVALNPDLGPAYAGLGLTYRFGEGDRAEGIKALEHCLELEPSRFDAAYGLVVLYAQSGRRDDAAAAVDTVLRRSGDPALERAGREAILLADLDRANELGAAGKIDEALAIMERVEAETSNAALRAKLANHIASARANAERARQATLFDEAQRKANARDYAGALAILDALAPTVTDPEIKQAIAELKAELAEKMKEEH